MQVAPFHLAFPVYDLKATRAFYEDLLGCGVGRTDERWIDFNFWGSQITAHVVDNKEVEANTNDVDGKKVPVKHFGAILQWDEWQTLAQKLTDHGIDFVIKPYIRFKGEAGEQATMFFMDPSGNAVEFKSFKDFNSIFAT